MQNYISSSLPTYVTSWLNTNVNPVGSAVIVDSSLTIIGAAADAEKTGQEINDLKSELNKVSNIGFKSIDSYNQIDTNSAFDQPFSSIFYSGHLNAEFYVEDGMKLVGQYSGYIYFTDGTKTTSSDSNVQFYNSENTMVKHVSGSDAATLTEADDIRKVIFSCWGLSSYNGKTIKSIGLLHRGISDPYNTLDLYSSSWKSKDYELINALEYGFVNDGITYNDGVMSDFIDNDSATKRIYFPKGTYLFNAPIHMENGFYVELHPQAEWKLFGSTGTNHDYFVCLGRPHAENYKNSYFRGGIVNANMFAKACVAFENVQTAYIENFVFKNFNNFGIQTCLDYNERGDNLQFSHGYIVEEYYKENVYGIYDNAYDNSFSDIGIRDCHRGICTTSSKFNRVHAWIGMSGLIAGSFGIVLDGSNSCFENCTIDTYQYGVISRGSNKHFEFNAVNFTYFLNEAQVYNSGLAYNYPPVVFRKNVMSAQFTSLPLLHVANVNINQTSYNITLTDGDYSEMMDKISISGVSANSNIVGRNITTEYRLSALES